MTMFRFLPIFAALSLFACAQAAAAPPAKTERLGVFGAWTAHRAYEGKNPVCYISQKATRKGRGPALVMLTHRPAESSMDVISYAAGDRLKGEVALTVEDKHFSLFTQGDTAWARDAMTDRAIAASMRGKAMQMSFAGTTAAGKSFTDGFSLKGAGAAYDAASKACGHQAEKPRPAQAPEAAKKAAPDKKKATLEKKKPATEKKKPAADKKKTSAEKKKAAPQKAEKQSKTKASKSVSQPKSQR